MKNRILTKWNRIVENATATKTARLLLGIGCVVLPILLTSCDNPEKDFASAEQANTETAYTDFIKRHPGSSLVPQAQKRLAPLVWERVKATNALSAYELFFKQFKDTSAAQSASTELVQKASYGDLPDGPSVDVTEKVRAIVRNGSLNIAANDSNFGDPFNGIMKLTITKAIIKFQYSYPADVTDTIKGFQTENTLHTTGDNGAKITVYYNYGDGKSRSVESGDDGSLNIDPPIKLKVDYTFNKVSRSKTVDHGHTLDVNDK